MSWTRDPRVDAYIDGLPDWQQSIWVGNVTSYVVENMSKDFFFGVRAVDTEGTRSPVVFPRP